MNARPERRRSVLTGTSPIAPVEAAPEPAAPAEPASELAPVATAAPVAKAAARPAKQAEPKRSKYPPKVSFYQEHDKTDRLRAAIMYTIPQEGVRSLSKFIDEAVMKEVERLENQYNDGKPFPPVGAREMPQGRPMGE